MVRHTSVVWDGSYICYGNTDVDVKDSFEVEAEITKRKLEEINPAAVFTSPLQRAEKLAIYCGYPNAERDARLKEMNFGSWEGRPWKDIIIGQSTEEFFLEYIHRPTPGGESQQMQYNRVRDFIMEKKAMGYVCILVFCHGGVINCARALAGTCKLNEAFATIPDFGSVTRLEF